MHATVGGWVYRSRKPDVDPGNRIFFLDTFLGYLSNAKNLAAPFILFISILVAKSS